jgi:hypothetical protein
VSSGKSKSRCAIDDTTCEAACSCSSGYSGPACEYSASSSGSGGLPTLQTLRSLTVRTLKNLVSTENADEQSVGSWAVSLQALAQKPHELLKSDLNKVKDLAVNILLQAQALSSTGTVEYASLGPVLQALDSVALVYVNDGRAYYESLSSTTSNAGAAS